MGVARNVLVIGSGIAGVTAAIEAARAGAGVTVACAGKFLSGSSFYPGTWGLGLIGPASEEDIGDLVDTILDVGQGVADPALVRTFVEGIPRAIRWLEDDLGVELKRPESDQSAHQTAFIPCFDHKHRLWRGITRDALECAVTRQFERMDIDVLEHVELIDLLASADGSICGARLYDRRRKRLDTLVAESTVLACGGTSGLFARRLTSGDVLGSVHGIALAHGCELANIEFMQMMPGLVSPVAGLVFNEKTFRYLRFPDGAPGLNAMGHAGVAALLEQRSGHGPFTARLADRLVDLAIDEAGADGLRARYEFPPLDERDDFVNDFATWLECEHGISPDDEFRIAMYAHASNGGIRIDERAWTGVKGLYACGEATGGMHGADRIGGLSSANGLVFGRIAGADAAARALTLHDAGTVAKADADDHNGRGAHPRARSISIGMHEGVDPALARGALEELREIMSRYAMINRTEEGLSQAHHAIEGIRDRIIRESMPCDDAPMIASHHRIIAQLSLASAMIGAMRARKTSAGSHYRADATGC